MKTKATNITTEAETETETATPTEKVKPAMVEVFGYLWEFEAETEGSAIYRDFLTNASKDYAASLTSLGRGGRKGVESFLLAYYVPIVGYAKAVTQLPDNAAPFLELPKGVSLLDLLDANPATFYSLFLKYRKSDDDYTEFNKLIGAVDSVRGTSSQPPIAA